MRPTPWATEDSAVTSSSWQMVKESFILLFTKNMFLLMITFGYTGLTLTFWSGVDGTCLSRTKLFGEKAKSLGGFHGISMIFM